MTDETKEYEPDHAQNREILKNRKVSQAVCEVEGCSEKAMYGERSEVHGCVEPERCKDHKDNFTHLRQCKWTFESLFKLVTFVGAVMTSPEAVRSLFVSGYINGKTRISLTCPGHGEYEQSISQLSTGQSGCKRDCKWSKHSSPLPLTEGTKRCSGKCQKVKPLTEFYVNQTLVKNNHGDGRTSECKECIKTRQKEKRGTPAPIYNNIRPANQYPCKGCYKNANGCGYLAQKKTGLINHQNARKSLFCCPVETCKRHPEGEGYSNKNQLRAHIRCKHKDRMEEMGVPPVKKNLRIPKEYSKRADEWSYTKKRVKCHIQADIRNKKRFTPDEREFNNSINNNEERHRITESIMRYIDEHVPLQKGCEDSLGGILPVDMKRRSHYGLFQLSMDRIDNDRPHFKKDDLLANIQFIPFAFNVPCSIASEHGSNTASFLRTVRRTQQIFLQKKIDNLNSLIDKQIPNTTNGIRNAISTCVNHCWGREDKGTVDKRVRKSFSTQQEMREYALNLVREQNGRSPISGIFFLGNTLKNRHPLQLSIDAIDPLKGHVKGNLRIVCLYENCSNNVSKRKRKDKDDGQRIWTKRTFERWLGVI